MPMRRGDYPADWEEIRKRILKRAGRRCEWCGVEHGAIGCRDPQKPERFWPLDEDWGVSIQERLADVPIIRIVLTVSHLDHDTTNNDDSNLRALCQRCHLRHDAQIHAQHAAETRRRKKLRVQPALFEWGE
jgi:hypothetical protein